MELVLGECEFSRGMFADVFYTNKTYSAVYYQSVLTVTSLWHESSNVLNVVFPVI